MRVDDVKQAIMAKLQDSNVNLSRDSKNKERFIGEVMQLVDALCEARVIKRSSRTSIKKIGGKQTGDGSSKRVAMMTRSESERADRDNNNLPNQDTKQ